MVKTTVLRRLRLRYGIPLRELAAILYMSNQQVSRIELLQRPVTPELQRKYENAIETIITRRYDAVRALERDYRAAKGHLLHATEE